MNFILFIRFTLDIAADYKTARGFSSRQYSDFFSLLFGDEDKENSTASWDYETETESTNTEHNTTNEKGLLDAIKDSLKYVDGNKQNAAKPTNVTNQTELFVPNIPTYNVSDGDDIHDDEIEDEDDEEISLLDFFLKGESAFTPSTTLKPFVFNITSKPLLNGLTNSPMQIQPILPDNMKNESLKFSMLPMSLYNMVKEDGSLVFDDGKIQQRPQMKPSQPPKLLSTSTLSSSSHSHSQSSSEEHHIRKSSTTSPQSSTTIKIVASTTTTHRPTQTTTTTVRTTTTTPKKVTESSSPTPPKVKTKNNFKVHASPNQVANVNSTGTVIVKNITTKQSVSSTQKIVESSTITIKNIPRPSVTPKPINSSSVPNVTLTSTIRASTTAKTTFATTNSPTKKATSTTPKATTTTTTVRTTTRVKTTSVPKETTTIPSKPLTTHATRRTTALPKITAVQINSNPSILEADINYDYSEPTLPPSLPNLRIIPFLPTDAVKKGEAHKNDGYKSNNYNYYHLSSNPYTNSETHAGSSNTGPAYSPFNIKPPVADDRVDYDTYKMPTGAMDSLDYISVYTGAGNLIQPQSFQMSVNSKLDYEPNHDPHKVVPSKIPIVPNKNLTVKPPLPPFEPEHEYDLYNSRPSQPTIHPGGVGVGVGGGSGYHEYNINAPPNPNEPYASEHNYNVPHFVTIPPMKEPPRRPIHNKESVFSYGSKNKFIPPAKTEGNCSFYDN